MRNCSIIIFCAVILLASCNKDDVKNTADNSTFGLIQTRIFDTSCSISGCHVSNAGNFNEHNLSLERSVAYTNLVGVAPKNTNALADQMLRVKVSNADESLLYHKLHSGLHHQNKYGNIMPLGLPRLSVGQIEFVRQWIEAGAPRNEVVADSMLLNDDTPSVEEFEPLVAPLPGKGFKVDMGKFEIAPDFEREFFVYKKIGNTTDVFVNRIEIKMRENSHHLVVYDFNELLPTAIKPQFDVVRDIRLPDGTLNGPNLTPMFYHIYVAGTQTAYSDFTFPTGVAIKIPAGMALDFNSHYVNKSMIPFEGEVNINFHTVDQAAVQKVANALNLGNLNFSLPANRETTITKSFLMDKPVALFSLTSHTHQLGKKFIIKINGGLRNGEIVYTSEDWHHPQVKAFNPPILLNAGEGLTSVITYNNTKNKTVTFGLTSEDEMGIIFGYYY